MSQSQDAGRSALVHRVNAGDADALQALLMEYHAPLHRLVEVALDDDVRRRVDVEDVLQEAYVAAFRALQPSAAGPQSSARGDQPSPRGDSSPETEAGEAEPRVGAWGSDSGSAPRFDGPAQFYGWLEQVVRNELRQAARHARQRKRDVGREAGCGAAAGPAGRGFADTCTDLLNRLSASGTSPSSAFSRQEAVGAVLAGLARLSDDQRAVVRLRFLEDVPAAEIARQLGKSEPAIHMLCHRGLKALREKMGGR